MFVNPYEIQVVDLPNTMLQCYSFAEVAISGTQFPWCTFYVKDWKTTTMVRTRAAELWGLRFLVDWAPKAPSASLLQRRHTNILLTAAASSTPFMSAMAGTRGVRKKCSWPEEIQIYPCVCVPKRKWLREGCCDVSVGKVEDCPRTVRLHSYVRAFRTVIITMTIHSNGVLLCAKVGCCSGFAKSFESAADEYFRVRKYQTTKKSNSCIRLIDSSTAVVRSGHANTITPRGVYVVILHLPAGGSQNSYPSWPTSDTNSVKVL
jgi:hypothetical protein